MKSSRFGVFLIAALAVAAIVLALLGPALFDRPETIREQIRQSLPQVPPAGFAAKGTVESLQEVVLSSRVQGEIAHMAVDEGDPVSVGQVLVRFDSRRIEAQVAMAEAGLRASKELFGEQSSGFRGEDVASAASALERAQAVLDQAQVEAQRQQRLLEQGAATRIDWEKAEERRKVALAQRDELAAQRAKYQKGSRVESIGQAQARADQAAAELKYYRTLLEDHAITSPIDGLVIRRHADPAESVDVGIPLLTLIDPTQLRIHAEVEETDVGRVTQGQAVEVIVDARSDKIYPGKVYRVFPTVSKKSQRTFDPMASFDINTQKVYIALDDYTGLVHGMTVTVRFLQ